MTDVWPFPWTPREMYLPDQGGPVCDDRRKMLCESVARYGQLQPVIVWHDGTIIDGILRRSIDPDWPAFTPTDGRLRPIVVDGAGVIIDGRARHEVDRTWPTFTPVDADGNPYSAADDPAAVLEVILELDRWH